MMFLKRFLVLGIIILCLHHSHGDNASTFAYVLPLNYNKGAAPIVEGGAVNIYVKLSIMEIEDINEAAMDFTLQTYMLEIWKDPRLKLNFYAERSREEKANPPLPEDIIEKIWKPDIVFDNAKQGSLFSLTVPNIGTKVTANKELMRSSKYKVKVSCQMQLQLYPMDTQKCFLKMALFSYPDRKAKLHWIIEEGSPYRSRHTEGVIFQSEMQHLKYIILPPYSYKDTEEWENGRFTYLYANFTFQRRISGSIFVVYVPSTLVVCLSWVSFWLDVSAAPARITLGVTSLLTLATQAFQARSSLPPMNYMTALDAWLFTCMITVFCSIVEYAVCYRTFQNNKDKTKQSTNIEPIDDAAMGAKAKEMDKKTKSAVPNVFRCWSPQKISNTDSSITDSATSHNFTSPFTLDDFSRTFFPVLFFTFVILYWVIYLSYA